MGESVAPSWWDRYFHVQLRGGKREQLSLRQSYGSSLKVCVKALGLREADVPSLLLAIKSFEVSSLVKLSKAVLTTRCDALITLRSLCSSLLLKSF